MRYRCSARPTRTALATYASEYGAFIDQLEHGWSPLEQKLLAMSPAECETALEACEAMCRAMWNALTGIAGQHGITT